MPSFKVPTAILASALLCLAGAQIQYSIDPNSVPIATRTQWCESQIAACPLICLQNGNTDETVDANDCDATTLAFDCVCGNNLSPNASQYSQTIPYFECQEYGNQCVAGCGGDASCQSACRADNPCGAQNPTRINVTTTSSAMSSTTLPAGASSGTAGVVYNGLGGSPATQTPSSNSDSGSDTKKSNARAAIDLGRSYGLLVIFSGLFAGFALII